MKIRKHLKAEPLKTVGIRVVTFKRLAKAFKNLSFRTISDAISFSVEKYLNDMSGKSDGLPDSELGADKRRRPEAVDTESQSRP